MFRSCATAPTHGNTNMTTYRTPTATVAAAATASSGTGTSAVPTTTSTTVPTPTLTVRPAAERGIIDLGWLKSAHTFSFGRYHDPRHVQHGALRVINDNPSAAQPISVMRVPPPPCLSMKPSGSPWWWYSPVG